MSWGWFILTHESGVCLLNLYPVMLWSEFGPGVMVVFTPQKLANVMNQGFLSISSQADG